MKEAFKSLSAVGQTAMSRYNRVEMGQVSIHSTSLSHSQKPEALISLKMSEYSRNDSEIHEYRALESENHLLTAERW